MYGIVIQNYICYVKIEEKVASIYFSQVYVLLKQKVYGVDHDMQLNCKSTT